MKLTSTLLVIGISASILSCKKEDKDINPASLEGNWKFISLSAQTASIVRVGQGAESYTTDTRSSYVTTQNSGTVEITGTQMKGNNLAYTIEDTVVAYTYLGSELQDETSVPFNYTLPPSNTVSNYTVVGSDSLHFTSGTIVNVDAMPGANGARFRITGNRMEISSIIYRDSSYQLFGEMANNKVFANAVILLERQ